MVAKDKSIRVAGVGGDHRVRGSGKVKGWVSFPVS